jgi:thioredoxin 1
MANEPVHIKDIEFEEKILKADGPVIVDFWAPWCNPCRMIAPTLDKLAKEYGDALTIAKINTDEDSEWALHYGVQGIPTMLLFYGGKLVHRQTGALPEPMLRDLVTQFMEVVRQAAG